MNKGFTLIELLAVIVILAIIALIATPIVLSIINDTKESAVKRSGEFYVDAVKNKIMQENMKLGGTLNPEECIVDSEGNVTCDGTFLEIEVDGEKPTSGSIAFDKGKVTNINLTFGDKTVSMNDSGELVLGDSISICKLSNDVDKSGTINISDVITCGTESFYVMENDGTNVTMLSMYNLEVGNESYQDYDDEMGPFTSYKKISNSSGLQSKKTNDEYAVLRFSNVAYWYGGTCPDDYVENHELPYSIDVNYASEGRTYPYIYGDYKSEDGKYKNELYPYVLEYENKLNEIGANVIESRLISYDEVITIKNNNGNPSWLYNGSYWTGSAAPSNPCFFFSFVYIVDSGGTISSKSPDYPGDFQEDDFNWSGLRPVIVLAKSNISY